MISYEDCVSLSYDDSGILEVEFKNGLLSYHLSSHARAIIEQLDAYTEEVNELLEALGKVGGSELAAAIYGCAMDLAALGCLGEMEEDAEAADDPA